MDPGVTSAKESMPCALARGQGYLVSGEVVLKRAERSIRYQTDEISCLVDHGSLSDQMWTRLLQLGVKVVGPFERAEQELSTKTPDSELLHKINEARESQSDIANTCRIDESTALSMIVEAKRISMLNDVPASGSTVQSANSSQARTDRDNSRRTRVYYDGKKMPLMTAYEAFVGSFIEAVKAEDAEQFMPLTCAMAEEYDWIGELTRD